MSYLASEGIVHSDAPSLDHAEIMQILLSLQVSPSSSQSTPESLLTAARSSLHISMVLPTSGVPADPAWLLRGLWTREGSGAVRAQGEL